MNINSEQLMNEIQSCPLSWDMLSNDYFDRIKRKNAWEEITNVFVDPKPHMRIKSNDTDNTGIGRFAMYLDQSLPLFSSSVCRIVINRYILEENSTLYKLHPPSIFVGQRPNKAKSWTQNTFFQINEF